MIYKPTHYKKCVFLPRELDVWLDWETCELYCALLTCPGCPRERLNENRLGKESRPRLSACLFLTQATWLDAVCWLLFLRLAHMSAVLHWNGKSILYLCERVCMSEKRGRRRERREPQPDLGSLLCWLVFPIVVCFAVRNCLCLCPLPAFQGSVL